MKDFNFLWQAWKKMDHNFQAFSQLTGLKCLKNCSHCCEHHEIHVPIFELYPLALKLYQSDQLAAVCEQVEQSMANCPFLSEHQCSIYEWRPSLCRVFGLGKIQHKNQKIFSLCHLIKNNNQDCVKKLEQIEALEELETFSQLHLPLLLHFSPAETEVLPIHLAFQKAAEKIFLYFQFQRHNDEVATKEMTVYTKRT